MKKDSLLKMKDLPATEEMLAVAREDVPVKVGSGWNTSYRCRYSGFVRSAVLHLSSWKRSSSKMPFTQDSLNSSGRYIKNRTRKLLSPAAYEPL